MSDDVPPSTGGQARHADVLLEPEALPRRLILRTALATVLAGAGLCGATYGLLRLFVLPVRPTYEFPERSLPAPHEVATVPQELFRHPRPRPDLKARQRAELASYGWVDRARRIVRIPVDVAIEIVAREEARTASSGVTP